MQARAGNAAGKGDWSASGSGAPADVPRFSAEYHSGSHAIVLKFKGCPRNICNRRVAFYEIEETFNDGTATPARSSGAEHRRLNPANGAYRFRARYCTFDDTEQVKSCGVWSAAVHETVSRTGPFAPEPALVTTTVPGDLPFDVGVTKGGDAYVNIPIAPAPGVNGLAPRLTIDYGGGRERQRLAEHQPADILGYGWRVGGLSAIHRCVKNRTGANVLTFTSRDGLCLDGEPLVLVSGTAMTAGAEYRTYRESFVKVLAKGAGASLWFEAKLPGGGARQYGNTADSRLLFHHPRSSTGDNLIWSLNRETDSFGNAAVYEYHEDERASVRHPKRIRYGVDNDAELLFEYASRADAETVSMAGGARTRHLLLHTVKARLDGRDVREYRLLSETTSAGWRRLDKVQLCAYGESGAASSRQCLRHLEVDWVNTTIAAAGYKTCVNRLEAPMGRVTAFEYGTIRSTGTHSFLFAERPFGEPGTLANTEALPAASDGAIKPVVTAMTREDGVGGTRRASYAYQGKGLRSTANWGFLGFPATRVTDSTNNVVVYRQFRMDAPHFGALAAEYRYHRAYGDASRKTLSKRLVEYAEATFAHGTATTRLPHRRRETVVHYENGVALGATRTEWGRAHAGNLPTRATSTVTVGTGSLGTLAAGSAWGAVPAYSFTAKKREWKTTADLENRTLGASWLVGFVCQSAEEHFKDGSATADRKRWTTRVPRANGMEPASESAFAARAAGCAGATDHGDSASLKLTTTRAYDSRGNPTSVATRSELAGHVPRRAAGASNFVDGRYPGRLANPLGHATTVTYDARFGTPKSVTDANGRTTRVARDPFGRITGVTSPDGVEAETRRRRCGADVVCASVDGVAPVMAVRATSPITPDETRYLDKLGRVVRVATEAFSGADDIHVDIRHDARGRVLRRSAPYFENDTAPNTAYRYDVLDRVTRETRPDGGETAHAYAAGTGGATVVTTTEKAYKDSTLDATLTTRATYNLLGEVASVEEGRGTAAAVTTTYAHDASGLLLTATAGTTRVAAFAYDAAGNRTSHTSPNSGATSFTFTALGELRTRRDALSNTTTWTRDLLGRRTSRSDPDGKAFWTYDPANGKGMLHKRCQGAATLASCSASPEFAETLAYGTDARPSSATAVIRADGQAAKTYVRQVRPRQLRPPLHRGASLRRDHAARLQRPRLSRGGARQRRRQGGAGDLHGHGRLRQRHRDDARQRGCDGADVRRRRPAGRPPRRRRAGRRWRGSWVSSGAATERWPAAPPAPGRPSGRRTSPATPRGGSPAPRCPSPAGGGWTTATTPWAACCAGTSNVAGDADAALSGHAAAATAAPGPHAPRFATAGTERAGLSYDAAGRMTARTVCVESTGNTCMAESGADHRFTAWSARGLPTRVVVGAGLDDAAPTVREDFAHGPDGARHFRKTRWREGAAERVERRYAVGRFEEVVPASASSTYEWVRKDLGGRRRAAREAQAEGRSGDVPLRAPPRRPPRQRRRRDGRRRRRLAPSRARPVRRPPRHRLDAGADPRRADRLGRRRRRAHLARLRRPRPARPHRPGGHGRPPLRPGDGHVPLAGPDRHRPVLRPELEPLRLRGQPPAQPRGPHRLLVGAPRLLHRLSAVSERGRRLRLVAAAGVVVARPPVVAAVPLRALPGPRLGRARRLRLGRGLRRLGRRLGRRLERASGLAAGAGGGHALGPRRLGGGQGARRRADGERTAPSPANGRVGRRCHGP